MTTPNRIIGHLRGNAVGYVALFSALGGTSYAAVNLKPGSVRTNALANGAVTHSKLAASSVDERNLVKRSLTAADFKPGALKTLNGPNGPNGVAGPAGPPGANGSASIVARARGTATVTAPHGATTDIPLSTGGWTQGPNDLNLVAGSMVIKTPPACTGSFGNSVLVQVDGVPTTFGVAPQIPASTTVTVPIAVGELMESGTSTAHQVTAKLANSCTKAGEDFTVSNARLDVVSFQ
jgi:hypothetical protein